MAIRALALLFAVTAVPISAASTLGTEWLSDTWPGERVRTIEVRNHPVRWRQAKRRDEGAFAGVRFHAPIARSDAWAASTDYPRVGRTLSPVTRVTVTEKGGGLRLVEVEGKILWRTVRLAFEVEQEPPDLLRFRLVKSRLGEYEGICLFEPAAGGGTTIELSTRVLPASARVPLGMLLVFERMAMLQGVQGFLEASARHG